MTPKGPPSTLLIFCNGLDFQKVERVPPLTNLKNCAFLSFRYSADFRRSRLVFFRQTTDLIAYVPLFTETDKTTQTTQAKFGQCKLSAKGPLFYF